MNSTNNYRANREQRVTRASAANRPGDTISYTNWPHEPLVGNVATDDAVVWTGVSIMMLLASIGAFVWYYAAQPPRSQWMPPRRPTRSLDGKLFLVATGLPGRLWTGRFAPEIYSC